MIDRDHDETTLAELLDELGIRPVPPAGGSFGAEARAQGEAWRELVRMRQVAHRTSFELLPLQAFLEKLAYAAGVRLDRVTALFGGITDWKQPSKPGALLGKALGLSARQVSLHWRLQMIADTRAVFARRTGAGDMREAEAGILDAEKALGSTAVARACAIQAEVDCWYAEARNCIQRAGGES